MKSIKNLLIVVIAAFMVLSCGTKSKDTPIRFGNYNMREIMAVDTADRAFYNRLQELGLFEDRPVEEYLHSGLRYGGEMNAEHD